MCSSLVGVVAPSTGWAEEYSFCVLSSGMLALFVTFGSSLAVSFSSSDATLLMHYSRSFSDLLTYDVEQLSHTTLHLMRELEFEMLGFFGFIFKIFGPKNV